MGKNKTLPTFMAALITGIATVSLVTIVPVCAVVVQMQQMFHSVVVSYLCHLKLCELIAVVLGCLLS